MNGYNPQWSRAFSIEFIGSEEYALVPGDVRGAVQEFTRWGDVWVCHWLGEDVKKGDTWTSTSQGSLADYEITGTTAQYTVPKSAVWVATGQRATVSGDVMPTFKRFAL